MVALLKKIQGLCPVMLLLMTMIQSAHAQWEVGANFGAAVPITAYSAVVKTGFAIGVDGKYRIKENFALGLEATFARLAPDKDDSDEFQNTRLTVAPLLFVVERTFSYTSLQPYIGAGLGISFFNLHYEISPTEGKSHNNVSFTMSPQLGLKYFPAESVAYFFETEVVLLADGPPQGLPEGEKMTGYWGIEIGFSYRFLKE